MSELDEMFSEMRFNVEGVLRELAQEFPDIPTCESQSHRAMRALDELAKVKMTRARFRQIDQLKDFLAVHRAVTLLEQRERNRITT